MMLLTAVQVLSELALPRIMADIVDRALPSLDMSYILLRGAAMVFVAALQVAAMVSIGLVSARISSSYAADLRRAVFVKAQKFSLSELNGFSVSSMIVRNTNDVTVVQNFVVMLLRMVLSVPVLCIGSIIAAMSIHRDLSRILLVVIPVLVVFFVSIILLVARLFIAYRKKLDHLNLLIREHLSGTRVIRAFVKQKAERAKFEEANEEIYRISLRINRILSAMRPGMMFIVNMATFALCRFGVAHVEAGTISVGSLMSLISYFTMILLSLSMLSFLMIIMPRTRVSAARISEVLDTVPEIKDPSFAAVREPRAANFGSVESFESSLPGGEKPGIGDGIRTDDRAAESEFVTETGTEVGAGRGSESEIIQEAGTGTVEFRNVSFGYPDSKENVISDVSFIAESGKTTAIIGSTGSGKSTLQRLIIRLYDVASGSVLLDGRDVRSYSLKELRQKIAYVPQKAVLFSGTVAENIRFGRPGASDAEVWHALETAQAKDFVSAHEDGIGALVSQGGKNFSGGQKQRLAIARALIKDAEVIVFDDSFSALDYATDARLRHALATDQALKK